MYIIAHEPDIGMIRYYRGKKNGKVLFTSGVGATKYAFKYKTFAGAEKATKDLRELPGGKKARLFIMPESVYTAYDEWAERRAAKLRKEAGIE